MSTKPIAADRFEAASVDLGLMTARGNLAATIADLEAANLDPRTRNREMSLAITNLEQAESWLGKSIAATVAKEHPND